ncbi:MAG TPA: GH116 family glycosyl hydrolase [Anaerolineales bacterium]|nr:GH116 family glycosyl hydrolase [Anaerolineales bacterium]
MAARAKPYSPEDLYIGKRQRIYHGNQLSQIAFPLGGIGSGCICLNGYGGLQDFSVRNRPALTASQDVGGYRDAAFAVLHIPEKNITRLVEGPFPKGKIYAHGTKPEGILGGGHEGLPRFRKCSFRGEFPFGIVKLSDPVVGLDVEISGFNPFIPLDDKNSSIPCAILEYTLKNRTSEAIHFQFSFHLSHLAQGQKPPEPDRSRNAVIPGAGVYLYNLEEPTSVKFGSTAFGVVGNEPQIKAMWFRGGWFDSLSVLWRELESDRFTPNDGSQASTARGRNGGSLLIRGRLEAGEKITYPLVIAWHFPNVDYSFGAARDEGETSCDCGTCDSTHNTWQPYYASQWTDAQEVFKYVSQNFIELKKRTEAFHDALFETTLPAYVLEAISANLAILKSPTLLRQYNGNLWGWEGYHPDRGCCPGSCTHVWNYAQALAHLFPALERTLRDQELVRSMDEGGHINFRAALPDGPVEHIFHAAADGQLGGIMKLHRDWEICGDHAWLERLYPAATKSIDYCIRVWDPQRKGVLEEPHHNTYDIEFWGPDGMCTGFYVGALMAMTKLAAVMGEPDRSSAYRELAEKGARTMDDTLFNGEYYEQKVTWDGLQASLNNEQLQKMRFENPEEANLYASEGPKYQYGRGCLSDGLFGIHLAALCGVETPLDQEHIRSSLRSIFVYNFRASLWDHANPQRPGYALGDEPGLLLCTWPHGGKPILPFVYSDEVWTGIEYQVAAHLIRAGMIDEGLTIVKALRSRYDGQTRNPWNEYECGSYYARAMSSYALLLAFSGFHYSAVEEKLWLTPQIESSRYRTFFSTASGWGSLTLQHDSLSIDMKAGELVVKQLCVHFPNDREVESSPGVIAKVGKECLIHLI